MTTKDATSARAQSLADLEREISTLFRRSKHVVAEIAAATHPDLGGQGYFLLRWIEEHGPVRASAIAETFGVDKATISRQTCHLEELGMVERTPDPTDGRAHLLTVTPETREHMRRSNEAVRASFAARLDAWDQDELDAFIVQLGRYNELLA